MCKKLFFVILLSIIYSIAFADVDETGKITQIIVEGDSIVSVFLSGTDVVSECTGGARWTVDSSDSLFKEKVSILLTAASAGKTVHLHHLYGWGCGGWDSNKIYYVDVQY